VCSGCENRAANSSPVIVELVAPHASLITQTAYVLSIFAAFAFPAYLLTAFTIDRIARR
jgi:MFS transporter, PHS family, inorganic phosphate transporter